MISPGGWKIGWLSIAWILSTLPSLYNPTMAQEQTSEEMFGSGQDREVDQAEPFSSKDRETEIFGSDTKESSLPLTPARRMAEEIERIDDQLAIGGQLYMRFQYNVLDQGSPEDFRISSPNLLHLYLDGRPSERLRAFVRGRLLYDFTVEKGDSDSFGQDLEPMEVLLDQFWLKFDMFRKVFVTLGRQPARWGSGRFWNPTDFLNQQRRDPLAIFDERLGVSLLKVHIPIESLNWNLYAVANLDQASSPDKIGGALRAEMLINKTELALSLAARKDNPLRIGLDLSTALGIFDLRLEAAVAHNQKKPFWRGEFDPEMGILPYAISRADDWIAQVTAGAEVALLYSDQDSLYLGVELFYNDAAYEDVDLYPWLFEQGAFEPFYLGRHYVSGYAMLMNPGSWNDTSFFLSGIANLSDDTWIVRLDYQVKLLTYLELSSFVTLHLGDQGEFRYTVDIPPNPNEPGLEDGLYIPAPLLEIGLWLKLDF